MMTLINRDIIEETMPITDMPIAQNVGYYIDDDTACCIGARLAGFFEIGDIHDCNYFRAGIDEFARRLGGNRTHVILMLREAGAGYDPISQKDWLIPAKQVWRNLMNIEMLPSTKGTGFVNCDLADTDLRGADLRGTDLRYANISWTDLRGADLRYANLNSASLCSTDFRLTQLEGASFGDERRFKTNFRGVDLSETDLTADTLQSAVTDDATIFPECEGIDDTDK